jgi:type I restriction-modification system DNA methylase subunit
MDHSAHNKIVSFIWSIADDCLRDVFVRGKYRDVILPMFVLRRLDCLLEPSKQKVLEEIRFQREEVQLELEHQASRRKQQGDPRFQFYDALLESTTYEDYLGRLGGNISVQPSTTKNRVTARMEYLYNYAA